MSGVAIAPPAEAPFCNVAARLAEQARLRPDAKAVVAPARGGWSHLTFAALDARSDALARGLRRVGIGRGTRTVLLVTPSLDFFALTFALFKLGAVLVLIDPGIGRRALLRCLDEVEPEAFVGIPRAHLARLLLRRPFRKVRALVTVGPRLFWGGHTLDALVDPGPFAMERTRPDEIAAILFTSGSTGIPKGAVYTHGIFEAQVRLIGALYDMRPGEVDVATFPPFALFDPALGATAVVPDMDARFPARADPAKIVEAIEAHGATRMFGSPALLDNLSRHCVARGIRLSTLRLVLSAGAPVRPDILARMASVLDPPAQVFTPFGATEALPVCSIGSDEVLGETAAATAAGMGVCVGRPAPETRVRIVRTTDEPIERWTDDLLVPRGEVGEITVRGPAVTPAYWAREAQTRAAKIRDGEAIVHRMGDLGWEDEQGRIWMCGRKSHRVETAAGTLHPVMVEEILNTHPRVHRTALVGVGPIGAQTPVVWIEAEPGASTHGLVEEVRALAARHARTACIHHFLLHPGPFPVDVRHNAKIEREKLAALAAKRLGADGSDRRDG